MSSAANIPINKSSSKKKIGIIVFLSILTFFVLVVTPTVVFFGIKLKDLPPYDPEDKTLSAIASESTLDDVDNRFNTLTIRTSIFIGSLGIGVGLLFVTIYYSIYERKVSEIK